MAGNQAMPRRKSYVGTGLDRYARTHQRPTYRGKEQPRKKRNGILRKPRRVIALLLGAAGAMAVAVPALGVSGAAYTTTNLSFDTGPDVCKNGNPGVNCNIYGGKQYVWTNGGPNTNKLLPAGKYFFAVLVPSGQQNPNDGGVGNLSDDFDTFRNRTFTVTNGEITSYVGNPGETPHLFDVDETDNNESKIRLYPYANTTNPGGVYIMAMCYLGGSGSSYPVDPQDCKYDAFKVPLDDREPPACPEPKFGRNADGQSTATAVFQDDGGIDRLEVIEIVNATRWISNFFQGTTDPVTLTGTKIDQSAASRIVVDVYDVAGNKNRCDPVLANLKARTQTFKRLTHREHTVKIRNGRPGFDRVAITVNGKRFVVKLRPGQQRKVSIRSALKVGRRNVVQLRGYGRAGAKGSVMIAG